MTVPTETKCGQKSSNEEKQAAAAKLESNMQSKSMDFAVQEACTECCKQQKATEPICRAPLACLEEGKQSRSVARRNINIVSSSAGVLGMVMFVTVKTNKIGSTPNQLSFSAHDAALFLDL